MNAALSLPQSAPFPTQLGRHLEAQMLRVDDRIRSALHSDVALVTQIAVYITSAGGKRMRPALTLLAAQSCAAGKSISEHATTVAAIVELIHTATLLHDDVVDESAMRRGRATANASFGNASSVLVGDFIYSRSFQMMVETGMMRVLEVLSEATNVIAEGEVHQLMNMGRIDLTEDEYLHVVRAKTAKLFEAASRLGAIVQGAPRETEEALARFGAHLGTAFQIADDVLDYEGDVEAIGKNLGDDLAEGKLTLPLIRALALGNTAQRATLTKAITERNHEQFSAVLDILHTLDCVAYARDAARKEAHIAKSEITHLPESEAKSLLLASCDFAVARSS
jgi:octaprenyl-diphosphate synthase